VLLRMHRREMSWLLLQVPSLRAQHDAVAADTFRDAYNSCIKRELSHTPR
jgi:hypothetical protein